MSLLLEALKKAELAKQAAKPETSPAVSPEPTLEPAAPVMTRERLPDISQPLEILTDDLPSSQKRAPLDQVQSPLSIQEAEPGPAPEPIPADEPLRPGGSEPRAPQEDSAAELTRGQATWAARRPCPWWVLPDPRGAR